VLRLFLYSFFLWLCHSYRFIFGALLLFGSWKLNTIEDF
jgi:hypothetical protein